MTSTLKLLRDRLKKLTTLDYIIVLILLFLLGYLYFRFSRSLEYIYVDLISETPSSRSTVLPPHYWEVGQINNGDTAYSSSGNEVAQVENIERVFWGGDRQNTAITIRAKVLYNSSTKTYRIDNQPILIGENLTLNFGQTTFTGTISNIYKRMEDRYKNSVKAEAEVTIKYRNLDPWHSQAIDDFKLYNSNQDLIAETIAYDASPSETVVTDSAGNLILQHHPINQDVLITLKLYDVLCQDNDCFFNKSQPLKIGHTIWLNSETVILGPNDKENFSLNPGSIVDIKINRFE